MLAGRNGFDSAIEDSRPYGGAWQGPVFVLTRPSRRRPTIGRQLLPVLVDELDLHLQRVGTEPTLSASLRYRPTRP